MKTMSTRILMLLSCALSLPLAGAAGCDTGGGDDDEGDEGATMRPGDACLSCHGPSAEEAAFTVAGTVFNDVDGTAGVDGATVTLVDADGAKVKLSTNSAGNFYTGKALSFPVDVTISKGGDTVEMTAAGNGDCNSCHGDGNAVHLP
ncbi:MAG: hypothetical protein PHU25_17360 [Deltaproteobacteria bacterium]|nr:hypothetical protein [Deltaproteobacteria bacterium]